MYELENNILYITTGIHTRNNPSQETSFSKTLGNVEGKDVWTLLGEHPPSIASALLRVHQYRAFSVMPNVHLTSDTSPWIRSSVSVEYVVGVQVPTTLTSIAVRNDH